MSERKVRAYLAPWRSEHGQAHAGGGRSLKNKPWVAAMVATLKRSGRRSHYRLRKQIVEPVSDQAEQGQSFRQFLLGGSRRSEENGR